MKIKKILAILSAASMIACLTACGEDKSESSSKKAVETETVAAESGADDSSSSTAAAEETTESVIAETTAANDNADSSANSDEVSDIMSGYDKDNAQETVIALLKKGFSNSFGENMKIEYDKDTQTYDLAVWQNGFSAALDTEAGANALHSLSSQLTSALKTMEGQIQLLDKTAKLKFSFLSDKDQETPLLVIENGEITYDITNE